MQRLRLHASEATGSGVNTTFGTNLSSTQVDSANCLSRLKQEHSYREDTAMNGKQNCIQLTQSPIAPCFASTIFKLNGATLEALRAENSAACSCSHEPQHTEDQFFCKK